MLELPFLKSILHYTNLGFKKIPGPLIVGVDDSQKVIISIAQTFVLYQITLWKFNERNCFPVLWLVCHRNI